MFDFGKHADYMAIGYAVMGLLLGGMVLWMYVRYRVLNREQLMIDQLEAEERRERAAASTAGAAPVASNLASEEN